MDYGRLLAAIWIMLDHLAFIGLNPKITHGISGFGAVSAVSAYGIIALYFFFLMSGLVITLSAQTQSAASFVTHRAVRLYPAYLVCMIATTVICNLWGPPQFHVGLRQFLVSLTMIAQVLGYRLIDASYWTLALELTFYAFVLVLVMTGLIRRRLQAVVTLWIALQAVMAFTPYRAPLLTDSYALIAGGSVLCLIYQRRNPALNWLLLAIAVALSVKAAVEYAPRSQLDRLAMGAMTVAIYAIFVAMRDFRLRLPFAERLGSLNYPLYLLHFHIGLTAMTWVATERNRWFVLIGVSLGLIAASALIEDILHYRLRWLWIRIARATIATPFAWWDRRQATAAGARIESA